MGKSSLRTLLDADATTERLRAIGVAQDRAATVRAQFRRCAEALIATVADPESRARAFVVPGRIEVLGKHTDYAGGRSLLAAAERGFAGVASARADGEVRVLDVSTGESVSCHLHLAPSGEDGWANYVATVVRRVARNFPTAQTGADIAFVSDLPVASGMSSSSALMVTVFLALDALNDLSEEEDYRRAIHSVEDLAGYLAAIENGKSFRALHGDLGVGTQGGSEDHTTMLCARPGALVEYRFAPVRFEREVPMPAGYRFVIAFSGVRAEKTGAARAKYNRAAALMEAAAAKWRSATGRADATVGAVLDADPADLDRLRAAMSTAPTSSFTAGALMDRVEQFVAESYEIIPAAGDALARGDMEAFGKLVDRSQALSERLLENQIDETVQLARLARAAGADAASAFGAGFGGSVWALVRAEVADDFELEWRSAFVAAFPHRAADAMFFQSNAAAPAARVL